jgi:hypothetical protein
VGNNPVNYTDPSGHSLHLRDSIEQISSVVPGGINEFSRIKNDIKNYVTDEGSRIDRDRREIARDGVAGILYNTNKQIDRTFGPTNDFGDYLTFEVDAILAPVSYAGLMLMSPDKALTDSAWRISNAMVALNFSGPGQIINAQVTYYGTGHARFANMDSFDGRPVVTNSMFGYAANSHWRPGDWRPSGFTPGPVSFVSPGAADELIRHEIGHQMQYDNMGGQRFGYLWITENARFECVAGRLSGFYSNKFPQTYCVAHGW